MEGSASPEVVEQAYQAIRERFKHTLQLIASPTAMQVKLLPADFYCKPEEMALEFDNWKYCLLSHAKNHPLTPQQLQSLDDLEKAIEIGTKPLREHAGSDEDMLNLPEWVRVRELAAAALQTFGWPRETPPSYEAEYVPLDPEQSNDGI